MAKTIWIVNYYTAHNSSNPRYIELANHFMLAGYDVLTINASTTEGIEQSELFNRQSYGSHKFVHVKTRPYKGNGLSRMLSIILFAFDIFLYGKRIGKPDLVLHNLHTPFDFPVYWAARRLGAKYIGEAWDLWPEDFVTFGLLKESSPIMKVAYWIEEYIYKHADQLIFTQEGALDYIRSHGWSSDKGGPVDVNKVHYINNGLNLEKFDYDCSHHPRKDADINQKDTYKIIYMGSIRLVNNVKQLIDTANLLKFNPKYQFFIYGEGTDREMLEKYIKDNNITNVTFKEKRIPFEEVAWVVSQATVNIMNYQKDFGIHGVSSGKMFQYMAAGKPICCNIKLNYSEISRNNLGIDEELDTPEQYAAAIRKLAEQPKEEYDAMCERVRKCAEKFDYNVLAAKEIEVVEGLIGKA